MHKKYQFNKITKICAYCGKEFETTCARQKYCTIDHRRKDHYERNKKEN